MQVNSLIIRGRQGGTGIQDPAFAHSRQVKVMLLFSGYHNAHILEGTV